MRKRKTLDLKKPKPDLEAETYEPRNKKAPQPYRNAPLVYLKNGPKKKRYRQN